ncbi:benenodin family lasso peptide [Sphingomonas sp.]
MDRDDDIIELGTASVETKGQFGPKPDIALGQLVPGLSDD